MYLILTQIHSHIFNLEHQIWRKINEKKRRNTFWNQYEIVEYEIREDKNLRGVRQS